MARTFDRSNARRPDRPARGLVGLATLCTVLMVAAACSPDASGASEASGDPAVRPSGGPDGVTRLGDDPQTSVDPEGLCRRIDELDQATVQLRTIELKLTNRVALDIELADLELAFDELQRADLGELEDQLETPLQRLDHRLVELQLAVEDFRTNRRPRRAAPHVEEDAATFAEDVAAFRVLARC